MRILVSSVVLASLVVLGCGGGGESAIAKSMPKPTKSLSELKQTKPEMTPEELAEARRKAGFKSRDEIAKENAAAFEADARKYVKQRAKDYKALIGDVRAALDDLEQNAKKWDGAKNAQKAFDKFSGKYEEQVKELTKRYMEVSGNMAEGGETQVVLGKTFRTFEALNGDLAPDIGGQENFGKVLEEIRGGLDEVTKKVEEIEKDESVEAEAAAGADDAKGG